MKPNDTRQKQRKVRKVHLSYKEREFFAENLTLLLRAAVPVGEIMQTLEESARSRGFKVAMRTMRMDIDEGYTLTDALDRSGVLSTQALALVRLGETSGNLVRNLELASQQEAKRRTFRSRVRSALIYPSFVIVMTGIVGLAVAWFLLPKLSQTFDQMRVPLPPISRALIGFGEFLSHYGLIAVPSAIGLCILIFYILFVAPRTKNIGRSMLLYIPGIGRLIKETEVAQFGYLLGTLMQAGLPVTKSLKLLQLATNTPQYRKLYGRLAESIDEGIGFKESLRNNKHSDRLIPLAVQQLMSAGERSGSLSEVLITAGDSYEQKSDITTKNLETIVEPVLLVIIAGGVLMVAIAVILPIYSLIGGLNQ